MPISKTLHILKEIMLSELKRKILGDPVYIKEKYDHDRYCDGGWMTEGNAFSQFREIPCKYCDRMKIARDHREGGNGEGRSISS